MRLKPITVIIVLLLVVASLSVAGCTVGLPSTSSPTPTPTSQVKQYADAWHKNIQDKLGPNETLTVWKEKENVSDTIRLQWTVVNSTTSSFYSNGSTTSYSVYVKQFANIDDATAFYNDTSFGYAPSTTVNATLIKPEDDIYQQVTGNNATVLNGAWKLDSFAFVTMQASFVIQQNEFVVWGTASVMPNGSATTTISTPTPEAPSVVTTPAPVATATPQPAQLPVSVTVTGGGTISKAAGGHMFYASVTPSSACGTFKWYIDGNFKMGGGYTYCGSDSAGFGMDALGLSLGPHTISCVFNGYPNYGIATGSAVINLVA